MKIFWRAAFVVASSLLVAQHGMADRLDEMISPIGNPVNFEDPRITTELRPLFVYHEFDEDFVTQGGDVQIYALQARVALTDRLALIATKDGYVDFNPDAVLPQETGFANVAAGFKYALWQDEDSIFSSGLRYEIPMGNTDVLQGEGDGVFNIFSSGAMALSDFNLMAAGGFRIPVDSEDSTFFDFDVHVSTEIGETGFFPVAEVGVIHVIDEGNRVGIADEGQDFFNLGASEAGGEWIVLGNIGARYRYDENIDFGVGYQFPINGGTGTRVIDWRVTADMIYRFDIDPLFG